MSQNQQFLQALDEMISNKTDKISVQYLKMHFIGPSGIGKTTTRKRLVGSITNLSELPEDQRKRCSTLFAECTQALAFVDLTGKIEFKASKDLKEETQLLVSYLMSSERIKDTTVSTNPISPPVDLPSTDPLTNKEPTDVEKQPLKKTDETATETTLLPKRKEAVNMADDVKMIVKRLHDFAAGSKDDKEELKEELKDKVLLNLVDIGGQPGFMEMFPFLSRGAGIFLAFFRLDKDLDEICEVSYERENDMITYDSTYTSRETLSQILSAITHFTKLDKLGSAEPIAVLVGTFMDELAMQIKVDLLYKKCCASRKVSNKSDGATADIESSNKEHEQIKKAIRLIFPQDSQKKNDEQPEQDIAVIQQTVRQHLNSDAFKKDVEDHLKQKLAEKSEAVIMITSKFEKLLSNPKDKNFIAVDNYKGTVDIDPLREHVQGMISRYFKSDELQIRPQQLLLGVVLRKEYDIVSMKDCIRIGTEGLKMNVKEVKFAVQYLDWVVGALIYRPDIKDIWFGSNIICNPQVVFNSLSTFVVEPLLELHPSKESNILFTEAERKNWIHRGQFSLKTITDLHSMKNQDVKKGQLIPVKKLLVLLEHSHLLATITTEEVETMYFIPALLDCASPEELAKPPPIGIDTPSPIKITFKPQCVPIGMFCAMISELVSRGSKRILGMTWKLATDSSVKRNLVSFHIDEYANSVTLIAHVDCYEIRINRQDRDHTMHELCSYVLSTLLFVMKEISLQLSPIIAFDCYCGQHKDGSKLCLFTQGQHPSFSCTGNKITLSSHQKYWFAKVSTLILCVLVLKIHNKNTH